jgi:hypothetical protein
MSATSGPDRLSEGQRLVHRMKRHAWGEPRSDRAWRAARRTGTALIGASLAFALVAPALLARVGGWRERRRRAMACVALLAVLCSAGSALAQQCTPNGTNQTCTNSIFLTGGAIGLFDNGTAPGLTVTNNDVGTISGTGIAGGGIGIEATTATVTNNGIISGTSTSGGVGVGIVANSNLTVTNNGTISGTGIGGGGIGFGIVANTTATVTNNGTISGTGTGGAGGGVGIQAANATVTNNGTISGIGTGGGEGLGIWSFAASNVTNNGTITGTTSAILFAGSGTNTLTLGSTSIINGEVLASGANNLLQLGGSGIGAFDVSLIGPAAQYRGFDTFNKIGAATWTLTGFNAGALPWTVQQGILLVNGSLANSPFTVTGGTLGGTGTIGNTQVSSGGTLAPGSGAPGTSLTIHGNLAFQSGALYLVQVNSTTASLANVTGTASLAGTVQANIASATNKSYDILHSAGLGGTRFNALVFTNPNFSGSLSYTATDVFLTPTANLGAGSNLNQNQQNVAGAINNFFNNGGALPPNFANIFGLTGGALGSALTQLDGEAATGAERAVFQLTNEFLTLMLDPFVNGRANVGGGGGVIGFAPDEQTSLPPDIALAYASILNRHRRSQYSCRAGRHGARLTRRQQCQRRPGNRLQQCQGEHVWFCRRHGLSPHALHGGGLRARGCRHQLGAGQCTRHRPQRCAASWCLRYQLVRPRLSCRRAVLLQSLVYDQSIGVGRCVDRDLRRTELRREARRRLSLRGAAGLRRDTLRCRSIPGLPHAELQRKRSDGRRVRAFLCIDECDRRAHRAWRALRRSDVALQQTAHFVRPPRVGT